MNRETIIEELRKSDLVIEQLSRMPRGAELRSLVLSFDEQVNRFDPGDRDRFVVPNYSAKQRIEKLRSDYKDAQYLSAAKTVRRLLESVVKKYISGLQGGLEQLDQE
tara:strand:+ start:1345 stop:1665 length:321 start_codon:yes stop_codon:yes gene_type:complete